MPLLAVLFIAATLRRCSCLLAGTSLVHASGLAFALFNAAMAAMSFAAAASVAAAQLEAANGGPDDFAALRLIVLPQAVTAVVPALVNIMIAVIKETTLLSVIGVNDLWAPSKTVPVPGGWEIPTS